MSFSFSQMGLRVAAALLPHHCVLCRTPTGDTGLCARCWANLTPITDPLCAQCGRPLPYATPRMVCGVCIAAPPPLATIRSLFRYNDTSRALVLKFKHGDGLFLAPFFARLCHRACAPLAASNHLVIPIPLHRYRFFRRRYNQSAEIARRLSAATPHAIFAPNSLIRVKPTVSQGRLNKAERAKNLAGAFRVPPAHRPLIHRQPILLVDDVFTTGATLFEAARTLQANGSGPVSAIVIARTVRLGSG